MYIMNAPMLESVHFEAKDVITTSGGRSITGAPCPSPDVPHLHLNAINENGVFEGTYYRNGLNGSGEAVAKAPDGFVYDIVFGDTSVGNWYFAYDASTRTWVLDSHNHTS